jgi:hypothetical protein
MKLEKIMKKISQLDIYEKRNASEKYCEIVFFSKDKEKWNTVFSELLGDAIKPESIPPSGEHEKMAEQYGGIRKEQVLYNRVFEKTSIMAMFWPWGNGTHITVKIAKR